MSTEVIKKTQDMLGKYVKKPPLTEKLLGKPPFRYLHDILNVVVTEHGFLKGLFSDLEMSSDNIKDKEGKIAFLQKLIDATNLATGEDLAVKPSKIVAGHEVENTNLLLQALAKGIEKKIDSSSAVKQALSQQTKKKEKGKASTEAGKKEKGTVKSKVPARKEGPQETPKKGTRSPAKPGAKRGSNPKGATSKGGAGTGQDSKSQDKPKSREKKEGSKTKPRGEPKSESKERKTKKDKDEKTKSKSKPSTSEPTKTRKPAAPSVEAGKENAPPEPTAEEVANEANGTDIITTPDEIPPDIAPKPAADLETEIQSQNSNQDGGPPSLLNTGAEGEVEHTEGPLDMGGGEPFFGGRQVETSHAPSLLQETDATPAALPSSSPSSAGLESPPSVVDAAILKAMSRDEVDGVLGDRTLNGSMAVSGPPPDSGVGSLESPKDPGKVESLPNVAAEKTLGSPVRVPIPPTPGPRPPSMKAYHPDLKDPDMMPSDFQQSPGQDEEIPERPKTGMGIRPRTGRKSARPPSARPAPPKVRERREVAQEDLPRPPTGKPVATVILDSAEKEDAQDDDETFTVGKIDSILDQDVLMPEPGAIDPTLEKNKQELLEGEQDAKGILVAQILETKKELEDNRREAFSPETPGHRRVPLEQTFQGDASRRREKELIQKDVEKLTSSIQALTRSVNPLAKMLDYLQEDFDSMQKELDSWRKENIILEQSLKSEQSLTDQQLEPLKAQLEEMESAIFDQRDRNSAIKSVILRNDERISRLLSGINLNS